jgi:pyrroline-5-carboxylate reductase
MEDKKIAILGGGNLGVAIANGLLNANLIAPKNLTVTRRNLGKIEHVLSPDVNRSSDNRKVVSGNWIVIVCVQPKQLVGLLEEIAPVLTEKHLLISTVTGVGIEEIEKQLIAKIPIVRAMPNTAIAIGASMTCLCAKNTSDAYLTIVEEIFNALGKTLVVEERLMKASTVLAASGIAFAMRYMRAATQAGIQLGFDAGEAQLIAAQTTKGAALLLLENDSHPETEIDKVTTPEGCTIAGLNEMEHEGLSSALIKGIVASFEKINNIRK